MNGVNRVTLVGNLGKDPDVKQLENGSKVAKFSLATNETYTNKNGEKVTKTEWHNITLWRNLAETAEKILKKGAHLYLEGKLRTTSYTDKDGIVRNNTEIEGESFTVLNRKEDGANNGTFANEIKHDIGEAYASTNDGQDLPY